MMAWYPKMVFYFGLFDASLIMLGGFVVSAYVLAGWDKDKLFERAFPALAIIVGSNVAAALVLGATKWLMG